MKMLRLRDGNLQILKDLQTLRELQTLKNRDLQSVCRHSETCKLLIDLQAPRDMQMPRTETWRSLSVYRFLFLRGL